MAGVPIDVSGYQQWPKVLTPSGGVYYQVPGSAFVYDPVRSQAAGHSVFWQNPKPQLDAQKKQEDAIENANSPAHQVAPVLGSAVGLAGGTYVANHAGGWLEGKGKSAPFEGSSAGATQSVGNIPPPETTIGAFQAGVTGSAPAAGNAFAGSEATISGGDTTQAVNGTGSAFDGVAPYVQGAVGAYQVYQGYNTWQEGDKVGGALQGAQGAYNIGQATGAVQANPYATGALIAANKAYNIHNLYDDNLKTDTEKATRMQQEVMLGVADFYTYGLASAAEGLLRKNKSTSKYLEKLDKLDARTNPMTLAMKEFGSSKDGPQLMRDFMRKGLVNSGMADADFKVTLADGSKFDIGKDGKNKFTNKDGTERHAYDVDLSDPLATQTIGLVNPIVEKMLGPNATEKQRSDLTGMLTNAVTANVTDIRDVQTNINAILSKAKPPPDAPTQGGGIPPVNKQPLTIQPGAGVANIPSAPVGRPVIDESPRRGAPIPTTPPPPARSMTLSPGIDKQGRRMNTEELGKALAGRINARR